MNNNSGEGSYKTKSSKIKMNSFHNKGNNNLIIKAMLMIIFVAAFPLNAQSLALKLNNKYSEYVGSSMPLAVLDSSSESVFGNTDSLFEDTKPKLLPDKMSIMESFLWGENGLTRKIGLVNDLSPEEREHELSIRRIMLTTHQIGGFTTLGLMLAADYFGQKRIDGNRNAGDIHQTLIAATIITYSATAMLAILSPPPLIRRSEESTTTLHKTLAWFHVAGMILTPILGSMIGGRRHFNIDKAHYHQISGYITTAIFAASMIVVTF